MIIKDIFNLNKDFRGLKLLAGEKGINNEIKGVNIMEVPDGMYWVKPGELIITTGYTINKGDTSLEYMIKSLIEKKAAGLGIKIGRFINRIPENILNLADEYNFPLIYIPMTTNYMSMVKPLLNIIENNYDYKFNIVKEFNKELQSMIKQNYNLTIIRNLLLKYIGYENFILYYYDEKVHVCNEVESIYGPSAKKIIENNLEKIFASEGRFDFQDENYNYAFFKIKGVDTTLALLCVVVNKNEFLTEIDEYIIWSIIPNISIYLISYSNKTAFNNINITDFYLNILEGRYTNNESKLKEDASYLNVNINKPRIVWILDFSLTSVDKSKKLETIVLHILTMQNYVYYYKKYDRRIIFIMELKEFQEDVKILECFYTDMLADLNGMIQNDTFNIGVSKQCNSLKYLNYAYEEANFSLKCGKKIEPSKNIFFYDDYMIYHLLYEIADHPTLLKIYRNTAKRLKDYDFENGSELLKTVKIYIENDFNINQASEKLFIHKNTLYKRIKKINKILDFDINNSESRLILQIAIKFNEILESK